MFPPKLKNKPAIGALPAKPKPSLDDLESPDPVEGKLDPEEADESPDEEGAEEYGEKLIADMTAPLLALGMDAATAKSTLADMFSAAAKCLSGESGESDDTGATGDVNESGTENYPA